MAKNGGVGMKRHPSLIGHSRAPLSGGGLEPRLHPLCQAALLQPAILGLGQVLVEEASTRFGALRYITNESVAPSEGEGAGSLFGNRSA